MVTWLPFFPENAYLIIVYNSINIYNNKLLYIYYFLFLGLYLGLFFSKKVTWLPFKATTSPFPRQQTRGKVFFGKLVIPTLAMENPGGVAAAYFWDIYGTHIRTPPTA